MAFLKALYNKGFKGGLRIFDFKRLFCLNLYFYPRKMGVFWPIFTPPKKNLKMASCKVYRISGRSKKTKKNVVITDFSKIEARLKALYVR